jgi:hypothetical protein
LAEHLSIAPVKRQAVEKNVECAAIRLKPNLTRVEGMDRPEPRCGHTLMSRSFDSFLPSDICLLLRADAEQHWLHSEVIPVLREIESEQERPEEEVGAALAYLEAMWDEATIRALETEQAHDCLCARSGQSEILAGQAGRYHAAVKALRGVVAKRVTPFVEPSLELAGCDKETEDVLHLKDTRSNGCAPRAA